MWSACPNYCHTLTLHKPPYLHVNTYTYLVCTCSTAQARWVLTCSRWFCHSVKCEVKCSTADLNWTIRERWWCSEITWYSTVKLVLLLRQQQRRMWMWWASKWCLIFIIQAIEVRDKYNREYNETLVQKSWMTRWMLIDMIHCPCLQVCFFHRWNACNCLKDIYYKLKGYTKRTNTCSWCKK